MNRFDRTISDRSPNATKMKREGSLPQIKPKDDLLDQLEMMRPKADSVEATPVIASRVRKELTLLQSEAADVGHGLAHDSMSMSAQEIALNQMTSAATRKELMQRRTEEHYSRKINKIEDIALKRVQKYMPTLPDFPSTSGTSAPILNDKNDYTIVVTD